MAKILLYVVLAVISCCGTVADDIECFPNQTIHYTHTDSAIYTHYTAFYEADNGTILSCVDYEDSNNDDVYFDCHSSTAMLTVHIYYENRTTVYTFQCSSETTVSETLITVSANQTHKSIDLLYNITSTFLDGYGNFVPSAEIGETVYFVITAPKEYPLLPLECNATGGAGQYKTIITLGCTEDDDLISSFSINLGAHETTYSAAICVFQFHGSDSLTITCNVRVCNQAGDCDFSCMDRKRRSLTGNDYGNYVTSAVSNRLEVLSGSLEGLDQSKG